MAEGYFELIFWMAKSPRKYAALKKTFPGEIVFKFNITHFCRDLFFPQITGFYCFPRQQQLWRSKPISKASQNGQFRYLSKKEGFYYTKQVLVLGVDYMMWGSHRWRLWWTHLCQKSLFDPLYFQRSVSDFCLSYEPMQVRNWTFNEVYFFSKNSDWMLFLKQKNRLTLIW